MTDRVRDVSFRNGAIDIAGALRVPDGYDGHQAYAALVIATPGSSVKEQIAANYATRLTERGFVTLAFDPSYQGQSGGEPRDLEDPATRVEDIRCAVDFLMTLPFVAEERVGLLGICAGGGYAVSAALTEHRVKALGTVVPVNIGRARRQSGRTPDALRQMLEAVGRQRTAEARGGAPRREAWIPDTIEAAHAAGITDRDVLDAVEFYRTPRGYSEHSTNRRYFTSLGPMLGFDAFHLVGELLTQPVQVIVAGRLGATFSYADGQTLFERANNRHGFHVVEGAGHYDMYDKSPYVEDAVDTLSAFFQQHLV
ncbi:alpha/beta hydrolase [Mangrovibrevibacter kandeliae]|uniref:alpha/beta hydrolase n=1 Tax=Mangrovibrevibacter kandeliae TaxID=2968473 RepID=UPI0021175D39|nr:MULTISPECIES: alpha/beta hydrolase [unclassified Aurantimonas]MCQ8781847.1 alpha/beta hydrolase [Aurantimonas sp. CSK15Z-1]MCW4115496.1 alpha/beta hydrolase [Aurantimonas sp. MSK8Z-1]